MEMKRNIEHMAGTDFRGRTGEVLPSVLCNVQSVYGGYIGDKLSKESPVDVWKALLELGVTQIIDLRYNYNAEGFCSRCREYGIGYFSYPVHNDEKTISEMVKNFSKFSELLSNGSFYMQGKNSSYVALCAYWVFAKNPGVYPYELHREIIRDAQLMKRVKPILYAMNRYEEEHNSCKDCLPTDYYERQRKLIRDFENNEGPQKVSFSIIDFTREYRSGTTVYDISIKECGTVGYLYTPEKDYGQWVYDIILSPSVSDRARTFEMAQIGIAQHLCRILPMSIKWAALPESVKSCVALLRVSLK